MYRLVSSHDRSRRHHPRAHPGGRSPRVRRRAQPLARRGRHRRRGVAGHRPPGDGLARRPAAPARRRARPGHRRPGPRRGRRRGRRGGPRPRLDGRHRRPRCGVAGDRVPPLPREGGADARPHPRLLPARRGRADRHPDGRPAPRGGGAGARPRRPPRRQPAPWGAPRHPLRGHERRTGGRGGDGRGGGNDAPRRRRLPRRADGGGPAPPDAPAARPPGAGGTGRLPHPPAPSHRTVARHRPRPRPRGRGHRDRPPLAARDAHGGAMTTSVDCAVAGGGPAGILLGLLLARRGVRVLVLEKHADFLRDFRGDTIHPSTLEIMDDLGLTDRLLQLPHHTVSHIEFGFGDGERATVADLTRLASRHRYVAFMPQWDLLEFLSTEAARYPGFELRRCAEVTGLVEEGGVVRGLRYRGPEGEHEVRARLVVGADGRRSRVRTAAGLVPQQSSPPMDVLWFRLSRRPGDAGATFGQVGAGSFLVLLNRGDFWQLGYVIPKGSDPEVRRAGLPGFRRRVAEIAPFLAGRVDEIESWDQVHLLTVEANRLRRW